MAIPSARISGISPVASAIRRGDRVPLGQQVRAFVLVELVVVHDRVLQ
jgi:hypothetical protein